MYVRIQRHSAPQISQNTPSRSGQQYLQVPGPWVFNQVSVAHLDFPVHISGPDLHAASPASMNCLTDTPKSTSTYSANTQSVCYIWSTVLDDYIPVWNAYPLHMLPTSRVLYTQKTVLPSTWLFTPGTWSPPDTLLPRQSLNPSKCTFQISLQCVRLTPTLHCCHS